MKLRIITSLAILCFSQPVMAAVVTHQDYGSGDTITSAKQNLNENTIFNEFNGNIDNANIKTGGVNGTNILDGTIQNTDIAVSSITSDRIQGPANNQVLHSSGPTLGSFWAYPNIVQIASFTITTTTSTASATFIPSTLTQVITPKSANNKILVVARFTASVAAVNDTCFYTILRGGNSIQGADGGAYFFVGGAGDNFTAASTLFYLDSPNSTSPLTYAVGMRASGGGLSCAISSGGNGTQHDLYLIEVSY